MSFAALSELLATLTPSALLELARTITRVLRVDNNLSTVVVARIMITRVVAALVE